MTIALQAFSLLEKVETTQGHFKGPMECVETAQGHFKGPMECVNERLDVKSTWIPTWHQMDHDSWSLWTLFKTHLLEVVLRATTHTRLGARDH